MAQDGLGHTNSEAPSRFDRSECTQHIGLIENTSLLWLDLKIALVTDWS